MGRDQSGGDSSEPGRVTSDSSDGDQRDSGGDAPGTAWTGTLTDTYAAAIQHDLVDLEPDTTLLGVVRQPPPWFHTTVDVNVRALGPPSALLEEAKTADEELKMQGLCAEGAHNAAWEQVDFEARYRTHLEIDADAQDALTRLRERLASGESIALVCFENTNKKRCHRTVLREVLERE
ncbi:DUF488 domain-containing protein [Natrialbaceae archaeon A-CW3]